MNRELDRLYLKRPAGTTDLPPVRSLAVLVVADGSDDGLHACLDSVAEHLPALPVFVHQEFDSGATSIAAVINELAGRAPDDADLLLLSADACLLGPLTRTRELLRLPGVAAVAPLVRAAPDPRPAAVTAGRITVSRALSWTTDRPRACIAISRAAWNTIGGFDEEYVGGGETVDWQARARAAGWRILRADEIGADYAPAPTPDSDIRTRDLARANAALLLEHQKSVHRADAYLAGSALADRLRRTRRGRQESTDLPSIVITTNRLLHGGAERQKVLLATELARRGYPVNIVCMQRFGPLVEEIPHTVRVVRQPWWAPTTAIAPGPAVLISSDTNTETGFATLWRAAGRSRRWLVAPHIPPDEDRPIYSRPLTTAMCRADGFVVLARRHWEMLVAQHPLRGRHFVVPNGVRGSGDPLPRTRDVGKPPQLVMLSRIVEHKNPHLLVEALGQLTDLPWELSIFGDGPDREKLQALTPVGLRERVHWRGWVAGPEPALAQADLLCVPSRSEAFPMAILEAMTRAVPVVSSAICAVPEMLDFGNAGFLVESVTADGWRDCLAQILACPDALPAVGNRGFQRWRANYTVEAMADGYVDAINAVL